MIGRNALCPCGSGDKVKRCCGVEKAQQMISADSPMPAGLARMILGRHFGPLKEKIERFQLKRLGRHGFLEVCNYFSDLLDLDEEDFEGFIDVFNYYFLYIYRRQVSAQLSLDKDLKPNPTAAEALLATSGARLVAAELELLKAQINSALSFWEVVRIRGTTHVELLDVITKRQVMVEDHGLASSCFVGAICFAAVMEFRGEYHFTFCASIALPPEFKIHLFEMLEDIFGSDLYAQQPASAESDEVSAYELISSYVDLAMLILYPQPPRLCNTDGDPLEIGEMTFKTQLSVSEVIDALKILNPEELVEGPDADGRFSVSWLCESKKHPSGLEMILVANFRVSEGVIVAEVNSRKRAKRAKDKLAEIFGPKCKYVKAKYNVNAESSLSQEGLKDSKDSSSKKSPDLEKISPEIREQMMGHVRELMDRKSREWINTPVPMLGNKTPREAILTPQGAAKVDALLASFENFQCVKTADSGGQILGMNIELIRSLLSMNGKKT